MAELVAPKGYPLEQHFVTTSDGYVLGVYRIPHGRERPGSVPGPPVLLQHGLLDSSATWVLNEPDESLAFILADAGYDVWLGNSRGNAFSRNHTGLSPDSAAFWAFTMDEMALLDVPALLEHVRRATGAAKVAYVGHSQGSALALAALSARGSPAARASLGPLALLAPAFFTQDVASGPLRALAALDADALLELMGGPEFVPGRAAVALLLERTCDASPLVCASALAAVCGFSSVNVDERRLARYAAYAPSGTSSRDVAHWSQAVRAASPEGLRAYDWGGRCWTALGLPRSCNRRVYGQDEPPAYAPWRDEPGTFPPVALIYGEEDKLADPADVARLAAALPPGSRRLVRGVPTFEHLDFVWGTTAKDLVYPHVLRFLKREYRLDATRDGLAAAA
ncbi:hypothetical protein QBZ16_004279 [Prototheca wickerhamii]|uniref:Lipase n=1 Tax=Prototheca wickerhamii TaxID=3111 RepID=A0AAD9IFG9_PROWI|nr:hypothetical protein QBZ16_004279 [Prototheca wickerhamii]